MNSSRPKTLFAFVVLLCSPILLLSQIPGTNVNMVSGTTFPDGDPFLQRQNEPSAAVSSRNAQHLLGGANDYRTVDIPMPNSGDEENGDAWLGVFRSIDGGLTWKSTLLPGYPQDNSTVGMASPLKNYGVATDSTVRAGTHGMFYYSGLAFSRNSGPTGVFVATFQDQNNKGNGNPFNYIGANIIDTGTSGQFLDKPWIAVDVPRSGTIGSANCTINGRTFTSGNAYLIYSKFVGTPQQNNPHTQILFASSTNCGQSWSNPQKLSEGYQLNQGTVAAIDPRTGYLYVAWRQLNSGNQPDAILFTYSTDGGKTFAKVQAAYTFATGTAFDLNGSYTQFRTISLPTMAVDGSGRVWLAFSMRNQGLNGAARIMMMTLAPGASAWNGPFVADTTSGATYGHQFLPSLAFSFGRLVLTFYDQRDDNTRGILTCSNGVCNETRQPVGDLAAGNIANVFTSALSDFGVKTRHTIDVRGAIVDPGAFNGSTLAFPSVRISQYVYGSRPGSSTVEQMQFNPPNFPMFVQGTRPFIGDYIDVAAQTMSADGKGNWSFNVAHTSSATFHPVWTDNRDVRPPPVVCSNGVCSQDWTQYTPVGSTGGTSLYDSTQSRPACNASTTGSRNQNIYTSQFTEGLYVAFRENAKAASGGTSITREFALLVANKTNSTANYRLTITQPPATSNYTASFLSSSASTVLDVAILPKSTVSRSLFIIPQTGAALPYPSVGVSVIQIDKVGGSPLASGLASFAITNPDITNPDITNPDITNPDITNPDITNPDITNPDIATAEIYNPTITNPDITNPDITNPDITNPDITNPDITNPDITNPDITNPDITTYMVTNPDITNPDITNPDITNPDITNPDITNPDISALPSGTTDLTWKITNKGNTTSAYNAKVVAQNPFCCPAGSTCSAGQFKCQLVLRKTYPTPVANACSLVVQAQNLTISNIPNPTFTSLDQIGNPDISPDAGNATLTLGPGEAGRMTLRVFGTPAPDQIASLKAAAVAFGANTNQAVTNVSLTIQTTSLLPAFVGTPYSFQLQAIGGIAPLNWTVFSGTLPPGLSLSPSGLISGTPTGPAGVNSPVTFRVVDTPLAAGGVQQAAWTTLSFSTQQFTVSNLTVQKLSTGLSFARTGDSVQVTVTVSNLGTIDATGVVPSISVSPSGALTCTGPVPPTADVAAGTTQTFTFQCTVGAVSGSVAVSASATGTFDGGASVSTSSSSSSTSTLLVDNTAPKISVSASNTGGTYTPGTWSTTPVTVTFTCSDAESGVATGFPTGNQTVNVTGTVATVTGTCQDWAGNVSTLNFGPVEVDLSSPVVTFGSPTPPPNASGWNNTNVTFPYTVTDSGSGVSVSAGSVVVSSEGSAVTGSVTVKDLSGNTATYTTPAVRIDKTPPGIVATRLPLANANGWNNTAVTVSFTCTDGLSGVANLSPPVIVNASGTNLPASGSCTDFAGNIATAALTVNIDMIAPTANITSPLNGSVLPYGATATMQFTCSDTLSGIASCTGSQANGSTLNTTTFGTQTVSVVAVDKAGNSKTTTSSYSVNYTFVGFQTPLLAAGTVSNPTFSGTFNLGKALPIKWDLFTANKVMITALSTLKLMTATQNLSCAGPATGPGQFVLFNPTAGATGGSTFRSSSSGYIFNWDTSSVSAGCWNLVVTLNDNTSYSTIVKLQ